MRAPLPLRVLCVLATMAAVLVPAWSSPARTIRVPRTLSASATIDRARGRVAMATPLTHVAFSWAGGDGGRVRFRTIGPDGVRSRWWTAAETHDLQTGDRHFSGVQAVYGAAALEFRRLPAKGSWMGPVTIDMLDSMGGPKREITVPSLAHGLATEPRVVTRAEWGADESLQESSGGCARTFFPVQQLFVHHTAGRNNDRHPRATMRSILWFHTARRGWCDIGYNFVVGPDGSIFEGRRARTYLPWETHDTEDLRDAVVRGAHTSDHNPGAVGISLMGSFGSVRPTRAARRALIRVLAWEADRHGLAPRARHVYVNGETGARDRMKVISGHRDASQTSCPGGVLYRMLPDIRRAVARRIGAGRSTPHLGLTGSGTVVNHGTEVGVTATLLNEDGTPLAGETVRVYERDLSVGEWVLAVEEPSGTDGSVSFDRVPGATSRFAAVYEGSTTVWGAHSTSLRVAVRPLMTLSSVGGTADGAGVVHYPAGTTSVALDGTLSPAHPGRQVRLTVARLNASGGVVSSREGDVPLSQTGDTFVHLLTTSSGRYRISATLPKHHDHARGRSADLYVTVDEAP